MGVGETVVRPWEAEARVLWQAGQRSADIGARFGVSASTVSGLAARRGWGRHPVGPCAVASAPAARTLFDRCAALHASMDALLAECRAIPTVKPTGRGDGERRVVDYRPGR